MKFLKLIHNLYYRVFSLGYIQYSRKGVKEKKYEGAKLWFYTVFCICFDLFRAVFEYWITLLTAPIIAFCMLVLAILRLCYFIIYTPICCVIAMYIIFKGKKPAEEGEGGL